MNGLARTCTHPWQCKYRLKEGRRRTSYVPVESNLSRHSCGMEEETFIKENVSIMDF